MNRGCALGDRAGLMVACYIGMAESRVNVRVLQAAWQVGWELASGLGASPRRAQSAGRDGVLLEIDAVIAAVQWGQ